MIRIIACGKVRDGWLKNGIEDYAKRIRPYDKLEIVEVQDEKAPESNSPKDNEIVKNIEGERILKRIKDDEYVILLDLAGTEWSSEELAQEIQSLYNRSKNKITFVIGGSLGLSADVIRRSNHRWCLSRSTLPHQLCRLVVLEQIYRAFKIMHHEPYHK